MTRKLTNSYVVCLRIMYVTYIVLYLRKGRTISMLKIGSHVSFSDKGLLTATEEAVSYGSSSFMIYTGAPQNTRRKPIDTLYIEEGREAMRKANIDEIVVHAPYIVNLGSYKDDTFELAVNF